MKDNRTLRVNSFTLLLIFLSGFCSLTYQVIWERTLKYSFGGDVISASIIVSVFLLGLGIGGFLFRKVRKRALVILALVELLIGVFGMWSYEVIRWIDSFVSVFNSKLGIGQGSEFAAVFLAAFIFLLFPTVLMGATLPLMFESFIPKIEKNTKFIGLVYGINTLGAFAGALFPPLVFGTLGLPGTLKWTALINIFIGVIFFALFLSKQKLAKGLAWQEEIKKEIVWGKQSVYLVVFSFMTGFIALALEILFIRFIGLLHGMSAYSFPIIISSYLLSMSLGSMFWSSLRDRIQRRRSSIMPFLLQSLVAIFVPLSLFLFQIPLKSNFFLFFNFERMWNTATPFLENGNFFLLLKSLFLFSLPLCILIFPVVFVSSGIFPTLIKNLSEFNVPLGVSTGILYLANSAGCVGGSLLTGFLAIPWLGWYPTLVLFSALSLLMGAVGILLWPFSKEALSLPAFRFRLTQGSSFILVILVAIPVILFSLSDHKIKYKLATGEYSQAAIISYKEGMSGVAAAKAEGNPNELLVTIYSNGQNMSCLPDLPRHAYLANIPRFQNHLKTVLVLGLGGGRNLTDLLTDGRVQKVVAVDWSKEVIKLLSTEPVTKFNGNPFRDKRLKIVMADAKKAVKLYAEKGFQFDAIVENLCFPHWPGAGGLKSVQYFKSIKAILNPDGYYYHIDNALKEEERKKILFTLAHVFEHIAVHNHRIFICGTKAYLPTESQVLKVLDKRLLERGRGFFVPEGTDLSDFYSCFSILIEPVRLDQLKEGQLLTDETPATEYYITLSSLWEKILMGLKPTKRPSLGTQSPTPAE